MELLPALGAIAATGALAGLLAGLLGIGGGLVLVPALAWVFAQMGFPAHAVMQFALGTSLASILFTGLSSVRAHHHRGAVRWQLVGLMAPALMIGAFAGSHLAHWLGGEWLMRLFGVFAALLGLQMLRPSRNAVGDPDEATLRERPLPGIAHAGAAGLIGIASAIFGIGGGSLTVPYLHAVGIRMQQAVATSSACGVPIAIAGAAGYVLTGLGQHDWPAGAAGFVYLPGLAAIVVASMPMALVGAHLAHRLPASTLRRVFALVLLLVAADFLLQ